MDAFTCIKPATFAGKKYMPGDTVPAEAIPVNRVGAVVRMGLIAPIAQAQAITPADHQATAPASFTVPIRMGDGAVEPLEVTPEQVAETVTVLQLTVEDAAKHIEAMTDATALIMIDACDSRKTVKKAAAARAKAIEEAQQGHQDAHDGQDDPEHGGAENSAQGGPDAPENGE